METADQNVDRLFRSNVIENGRYLSWLVVARSEIMLPKLIAEGKEFIDGNEGRR